MINPMYNPYHDQLVMAATALQQQQQLEALTTGSKDTTFTKIFVGGLPYHTSDKTLEDYFKQFGEIEEAVVITDRQTQKSRGYGFVTMKERTGAELACKDPNPIIDGRKANVNLAYLGAKPRGNAALANLQFQSVPPAAGIGQQAAILQPAGRINNVPQLYYTMPTAGGAATAGLLPPSSALLIPPTVSPVVSASQYIDYAAALSAAQQQSAAAAAAQAYDPYMLYSASMQNGGVLPSIYGVTMAAALAAQSASAGNQPNSGHPSDANGHRP